MSDVIKRISELEVNSLMFKIQLESIDKNTESLITKADNAVIITTEVSAKLSDILRRLDELSSKIADNSRAIVDLKIDHAKTEAVIRTLEGDLSSLNVSFLEQIRHCQFKFDDSASILVNLKNEQNIFIQKTDKSIEELSEDDEAMRKTIATIQEVLNEMEKVRHGWTAIKYVAAAFAAALTFMVAAREVYDGFIK